MSEARRVDSNEFVNLDDYADGTLPPVEFLLPEAPEVVYGFLREVAADPDRLRGRIDARYVHGHLFGSAVVYVEERVMEPPGRRICFSLIRVPMESPSWRLYDVLLHPEGLVTNTLVNPEPDIEMLTKLIDEFMEPYR